MIEKSLLKELRERCQKEKALIENDLRDFAKKDRDVQGNWETRYPKWDRGESGSSALETMADEVEEYDNRLPVEYALEIKLRNINLALEKMEKGKYGICERCGKEIEIERLKAVPEARLCLSCKKAEKRHAL